MCEWSSRFENVIQSVANHNPDVIVLSGYYREAGLMIKQAKGKWDGKPVIGGDGLDSPDFFKLAGDTKTQTFITSHFAADAPDEQVRNFAASISTRRRSYPRAAMAPGEAPNRAL